jgi:glycolate oxidase
VSDPLPLEWLPTAGVRFSTDPAVLADRRADRSGWPPVGWPTAVVFPASAVEVSRVLRLAHDTRTPVVPRGAGTGLSGGATAGTGTVVLDLSRMNRISPDDATAIAEPGVITADLDRAAAAHGLRYAPDPASVAISTLGGNIATNAGGLRCAKYGVTRDSVLGLEVVLADGRQISTGTATLKGVAGYDLTRLFVGSEGTLGVIVRATLRLRPIPLATATIAASFADMEAAAAAAIALSRAGVQPAIAELLDEATLLAIDAAQGTSLRSGGAALLLIQTDGLGAAQEAALIAEVLAGTAVSLRTTTDEEEAEELLAARRLALPSLERIGRPLIEDIAVPRSRLADAVREIAAIAARHEVLISTLAHAGDGNVHPLIVVDRAAAEIPDNAQRAADEVFELALKLGGTVTGEHGIGTLKRDWLDRELGETSHGLQQQLRALFDPHAILNPGKAV